MQTSTFVPSRSYPYLSIAKEFGLSYGLVLSMAEANLMPNGSAVPLRLHPAQDEIEPLNDMINDAPGRFEFLLYNMQDAARHYIFVQKYGIEHKDVYDLCEWVDELPVEEWPHSLADDGTDIPF